MISADKLPLNEMARELYTLQQEVKKRERRIEEIKMHFRGKGNFATKDYIVSVREVKREMVGPNDMIKQVIGLEQLDKLGLIYNQTYLIVGVEPKGLPQGFL